MLSGSLISTVFPCDRNTKKSWNIPIHTCMPKCSSTNLAYRNCFYLHVDFFLWFTAALNTRFPCYDTAQMKNRNVKQCYAAVMIRRIWYKHFHLNKPYVMTYLIITVCLQTNSCLDLILINFCSVFITRTPQSLYFMWGNPSV